MGSCKVILRDELLHKGPRMLDEDSLGKMMPKNPEIQETRARTDQGVKLVSLESISKGGGCCGTLSLGMTSLSPSLKTYFKVRQWWHLPLPDLCEFEASLVYRASSRTARATQRNLILQN